MGQVSVTVAGRLYRMACGDGEEAHLEALAKRLDGKIAELKQAFGEIGDMRLHVMAALFFADEAAEVKQRLAAVEERLAALEAGRERGRDAEKAANARVVEALEGATRRIEQLAKSLAVGGG
jgi:cell division protein ZapA